MSRLLPSPATPPPSPSTAAPVAAASAALPPPLTKHPPPPAPLLPPSAAPLAACGGARAGWHGRKCSTCSELWPRDTWGEGWQLPPPRPSCSSSSSTPTPSSSHTPSFASFARSTPPSTPWRPSSSAWRPAGRTPPRPATPRPCAMPRAERDMSSPRPLFTDCTASPPRFAAPSPPPPPAHPAHCPVYSRPWTTSRTAARM
mmetsp:Transcript_21282/g.68754  ORF Transcript_21282/g.68754 Transcript_21282/m.68754 type:complete len:201 (+) Transcript_21282:227-829(+)